MREGETRKIEEDSAMVAEMKEKNEKSKKFFTLLQSLVDEDGNLLGLDDEEVSGKLFETMGYEEWEQLCDDQELIALTKQTLADQKTALINKIKLTRLLCDISNELFDEGQEKENWKLLEFLHQSTTGNESTLLERIYASAAISESGHAEYFPGLPQVETGHDPEEKYNLHDTELAPFLFQLNANAIKKINADRGDHEFFEDLQPLEIAEDSLGQRRIRGDYITSRLSPKLGGVYSLRGDLVGWFNLPSESEIKEAQKNLEEKDLQKILAGKGPQKIKIEDVSDKSAVLSMDKVVFDQSKPEEITFFKIMESLPARIEIKKQLGVELSDFPLRVQKQFLSFITLRKSEIVERMNQFLNQTPGKESRNNRITSFLSLEADEGLGERILSLGDNLETNVADKIFAKYAECASKVQDVADYLHKVFSRNKKYSEEAVEKIAENLLRHGKNLLVKFADQAQKTKIRGQKIDSQIILQQLENIETNILLFASTFKAVSAEQKIDFRDVAGTELKTPDSSELTAEEKKEMERIFIENRPNYSKRLLATTRREFEEAMETPGKKFYLLTHEDELVSFLRFDQLPNGNLYLGSVNVRPEVRGSTIGSAMLKAAIDQEASNRNLEAVVYEKNPMLKHYLEDFGFKIVGEIPDYHGTGQKFLKIERPAGRKAIKKRQPTQELAAAA